MFVFTLCNPNYSPAPFSKDVPVITIEMPMRAGMGDYEHTWANLGYFVWYLA